MEKWVKCETPPDKEHCEHRRNNYLDDCCICGFAAWHPDTPKCRVWSTNMDALGCSIGYFVLSAESDDFESYNLCSRECIDRWAGMLTDGERWLILEKSNSGQRLIGDIVGSAGEQVASYFMKD